MKYTAKEVTYINGYHPVTNARGVTIQADNMDEAIETFGAYCKQGYTRDGNTITDIETGKHYTFE